MNAENEMQTADGLGGQPGELTAAEEARIIEVAKRLDLQPEQVADLERIRDGFGVGFDADQYSNDELLALGIGYGIPGPLADEQIRREAAEILEEGTRQTPLAALVEWGKGGAK